MKYTLIRPICPGCRVVRSKGRVMLRHFGDGKHTPWKKVTA